MHLRFHKYLTSLALLGVVAVTSFSLAQPISGASTTLRAAVRGTVSIGASGGTVTMRVLVHGAKSCRYTADPDVSGFAGAARCTNGAFTRTGILAPNIGAKRYVELNVNVVSGTKSHWLAWIIVQQGYASPSTTTTTAPGSTTTTSPTTTTITPTTTTTLGKNVVIENFSGNFTVSEVPFTTKVSETLVWSWTNNNGDYATGFKLFNAYTNQTLVSYDVPVVTNTPNAIPGGNGSITIPPGTYWLDISCAGPWHVTIS